MKEITNIKQLRHTALAVISGLVSEKIEPETAEQINRSVRNVIGTIRTEIEYAVARKEKPEIEFLQSRRRSHMALKG